VTGALELLGPLAFLPGRVGELALQPANLLADPPTRFLGGR
jgi:hypothetical protein